MRRLDHKYIAILLILLFSQALGQGTVKIPNDRKTINFIVISDVHISNDKSKDERLMQLVEMVNAPEKSVDFLVITGDLVSSIFVAGKERSDGNNRLLKAVQILKNLKIPFFPVMGNHDYKIDNAKDSDASFSIGEIDSAENIWIKTTGFKSYYCVLVKNCSFVFLNSMRGRPNGKFFDEEQLNWFEDILYNSECVIIFTHHPPLDERVLFSGKNFITPWVENRFFELLRKYKSKIKSIFCGHIHKKLFYRIFDQIPVYVSDSFGESKKAHLFYVQIKSGKTCKVIVNTKNVDLWSE